jgi:1-deoxy-D-xylulose-5-phosphate reductoisomerase
LARSVGRAGGTAPAVYNAANEEAVAAFLAGQLPFPAIVDTVASVVDAHAGGNAETVEDVLSAEAWAQREARAFIGTPVEEGGE